MSKTCFKCGIEKPLTEFYPHKRMADGHVNKCKECNKVDIRENYSKNKEYYQEYDKKRAMAPHRVAARKAYQNTEDGKDAVRRAHRNSRKKFPEKFSARRKLKYNIDTGKIIKPSTCSICGCGGRIHGHHEDYSKPLDVVWLCVKCHSDVHKGVINL